VLINVCNTHFINKNGYTTTVSCVKSETMQSW